MLCNAHWCLLLPGSITFEQMTAWLIPSIPLFLCIDLSQCKQSMEAILSFLPQLASTESISIIPPIDSLQCLSRGSAVSVIEWGFFFFPLCPLGMSTHTHTLTAILAPSLPDVARAIELLEKLQETGDVPGHKLQSLKKVLQSEFCTAIREVSHCQGREPPVREHQHDSCRFILFFPCGTLFIFIFWWPFSCQRSLLWCFLHFSSNHSLCSVLVCLFLGDAVHQVVVLSPVQSQLLCCPARDLDTFSVYPKQTGKVEVITFCEGMNNTGEKYYTTAGSFLISLAVLELSMGVTL